MSRSPGARRTTDTARVEAFSDAVFAIALTLLVLDLRPPATGHFVEGLLDDWPGYLAYLVAFLTIASIWLSHHNAFARVRRIDPPALLLNLGLLLGASLVPWPTTLVATAIRGGVHEDQVAAVAVYSLVTVVIGVSWSLLSHRLATRPHQLADEADAAWFRRNRLHSAGTLLVAVVAVLLSLVSPVLSLVLFVVVPMGFMVVSLRAEDADER